MTQTHRIILNLLATYGRNLYALACGLFTGRWLLMSLGHIDYGLMGVVGGLSAFITFFNSILSAAIGRYYAYSVGAAKRKNTAIGEGIEGCRKWFTISVMILTVIPVILLSIGYPLGIWTIDNFLVIPQDRLSACYWVFRFVCLSCLVNMLSIPFRAMYVAKQYIAELTMYSFISTTANLVFVIWMLKHPGVWLTKYSFFSCVIVVVPQLMIILRACTIFKECKFVAWKCWSFSDVCDLFTYAGWNALSVIGYILRGQGVAILINKCFGARVNASMSIANTVNGHANSLSAALINAFLPAITTAYGAGDYSLMRKMAFRACKFGLCLSLVFVIPLSLELPNVMSLWLKSPPPYVSGLCFAMMISLLIDKSSIGHGVAVGASGDVALYQIVVGGGVLMSLPLALLFVILGGGVYSVVVALIVAVFLSTCGRVLVARKVVGLQIRHWFYKIIMPISFVVLLSASGGYMVRYILEGRIARIVMTSVLTEMIFIPLVWFIVLDCEEREYAKSQIRKLVRKFDAL